MDSTTTNWRTMADTRIAPLGPTDRRAWEPLAHAYKTFYLTELAPAEYDAAWERLMQDRNVHGLGAWQGEKLIGIAHYLYHPSVWASTACYLQDMFVVPEARGRGVARELIEAVAHAARQHGAKRYYWLTHEQNVVARALYDKVGTFEGFIRYDCPLE